MKKATYFSLIVLFSTLFGLASCNEQSVSPKNLTKEDSIAFAKSVIENYPEVHCSNFGSFEKTGKKFEPKDWATILEYAENYDSIPLINDKGFMITRAGLDILRSNLNYKNIYLRLGKHSRDRNNKSDYTVMIVPLDQNDNVLHKLPRTAGANGNNNYDQLDPCPTVCPKDWDN